MPDTPDLRRQLADLKRQYGQLEEMNPEARRIARDAIALAQQALDARQALPVDPSASNRPLIPREAAGPSPARRKGDPR